MIGRVGKRERQRERRPEAQYDLARIACRVESKLTPALIGMVQHSVGLDAVGRCYAKQLLPV